MQNKGLAPRLNEAIFLSRGKYFARMDHDDLCHPDRFFYQIKYLEEHTDVDLLGCQCLTINDNNIVVDTLPIATTHLEICSQPWRGFYIPHPTWTGKIEWFKKHLYANPAPVLCEDQELLLRTYTSSNFYNLPLFLLAYRVRSKFKLRKSIKTRLSLCRMQLRYFSYKKNTKFIVFVFAITSLRIFKDSAKWLLQPCSIFRKEKKFPLLTDTDRTSWDKCLPNQKK
jgi:glycosyltransferase involved in cell wall biosynthesis